MRKLTAIAQVPRLYREHFSDCRRERQFLSAGSFFVTFSTVRAITHSIRAGIGPFRNITPGGRHIHHMTFGIAGPARRGVSLDARAGIGTGHRGGSRATSIAYGAGAALTLDEFALWLNLQDDYWTKQGRESIDAVLLFGALLTTGVFGRDFLGGLRDLVRDL